VSDGLHSCQLYLVLEVDPSAHERLAAALDMVSAAAVLIAPCAREGLSAGELKPLIKLCQSRDVAALIAGDAQLARTLHADGVHLPSGGAIPAYDIAREIVGRSRIVGADAGISRHDAMTLAEAGADYIAFGAPSYLKDRAKGRARRREMIAWWSELFEVPCVAFDVETASEAAELARLGADFVAVALTAERSVQTASEHIAAIADAVAELTVAT
jgi:thiamine-phosphate pyrophosphorylase